MSQGEYTFRHQQGAKGYYGIVRLEVTTSEGRGLTIAFDEKAALDWRIGVQFGITYGWEIFTSRQPNGKRLDVRVLEITGQAVDTTNLLIAFVAANALWKALEWTPPKPPAFDPKTGCFTFSKY